MKCCCKGTERKAEINIVHELGRNILFWSKENWSNSLTHFSCISASIEHSHRGIQNLLPLVSFHFD